MLFKQNFNKKKNNYSLSHWEEVVFKYTLLNGYKKTISYIIVLICNSFIKRKSKFFEN